VPGLGALNRSGNSRELSSPVAIAGSATWLRCRFVTNSVRDQFMVNAN
jgi:hypothetical protein